MEAKTTEKHSIWNIVDRIEGDKVIWIIVIMLILFSLVAIFSSTSLKTGVGQTRMDIFFEQSVVAIIGFAFIVLLYFFGNIGIIRALSQLCFLFSAILLVMLRSSANLRELTIGGVSLQPYEFIKVAMVLYLSWAVQASKTDSYFIANRLAGRWRCLRFLAKPAVKRIIYIHLPIIIVTLGIMMGGFSSAMFTAAIMLATVVIAGIPGKDIIILIAVIVAAVSLSYIAWKVTGWEVLGKRWETVEARIERAIHPKDITEFAEGSEERKEYLDKMRQPEGAKIAVMEGGFLGKGPGRSTQKYAVADMYGDFMFCFILEEYGFIAGLLLITLYVSLLARGAIIARYCTSDYTKAVVAGLVLLISLQAMMHMYINVGLGPLTGQTLPMISYGKSSFIAFSIAFGILLSISRTVRKQVREAEEAAAPVVEKNEDEVQSAMSDLE